EEIEVRCLLLSDHFCLSRNVAEMVALPILPGNWTHSFWKSCQGLPLTLTLLSGRSFGSRKRRRIWRGGFRVGASSVATISFSRPSYRIFARPNQVLVRSMPQR